jgi:outer membrane protein TolC
MVGLEAQEKATVSFIKSLKERENEMAARVEVGRALRADLLKVKLDLERAMLDLQRLRNSYEVAAYRLGRSVGRSGAVYPEYDIEEPIPPVPALEDAIQRAVENRPDLAELKANMEAFEFRYKAVGAEALPEARARGTWTWNDGDAFNDGGRYFAALEVSWNPFNGGTRKLRKAAIEAQRKGIEAQLEDVTRQVRIDIRQAMSDLNTAMRGVEVALRGVDFATETLRVERERHANGRATTNDLLDAEAQLRDQVTNLDLARLDVARAFVALKLNMGELK